MAITATKATQATPSAQQKLQQTIRSTPTPVKPTTAPTKAAPPSRAQQLATQAAAVKAAQQQRVQQIRQQVAPRPAAPPAPPAETAEQIAARQQESMYQSALINPTVLTREQLATLSPEQTTKYLIAQANLGSQGMLRNNQTPEKYRQYLTNTGQDPNAPYDPHWMEKLTPATPVPPELQQYVDYVNQIQQKAQSGLPTQPKAPKPAPVQQAPVQTPIQQPAPVQQAPAPAPAPVQQPTAIDPDTGLPPEIILGGGIKGILGPPVATQPPDTELPPGQGLGPMNPGTGLPYGIEFGYGGEGKPGFNNPDYWAPGGPGNPSPAPAPLPPGYAEQGLGPKNPSTGLPYGIQIGLPVMGPDNRAYTPRVAPPPEPPQPAPQPIFNLPSPVATQPQQPTGSLFNQNLTAPSMSSQDMYNQYAGNLFGPQPTQQQPVQNPPTGLNNMTPGTPTPGQPTGQLPDNAGNFGQQLAPVQQPVTAPGVYNNYASNVLTNAVTAGPGAQPGTTTGPTPEQVAQYQTYLGGTDVGGGVTLNTGMAKVGFDTWLKSQQQEQPTTGVQSLASFAPGATGASGIYANQPTSVL